MPLRILRPYLAMLPRLAAEESLAAVQVLGVGTGVMRVEDRRAAIADWQRHATEGQERVRPSSRAGHAALVAGAGIGIRVVPRRASA